MKERPKCAFPECSNPALTLFSGRWICGECYMNQWRLQQDKKWEDAVENA